MSAAIDLLYKLLMVQIIALTHPESLKGTARKNPLGSRVWKFAFIKIYPLILKT